jgi:putative aldouronate transport system substrate-binding protein
VAADHSHSPAGKDPEIMSISPMSRRRVLAGSAVAAAATTLAACGDKGGSESQDKLSSPDDNFNAEGMPVVDDTVKLSFMTGRYSTTADDWNTIASVKEMEKRSNIHVDWGLVPFDATEEKRNLALASGDYPEVFSRMGFGAADLAKNGEQGSFLALNDAVENYMPNLKKLLDQYPDIRKGMTMPDGNIYGLPLIYDPDFESLNISEMIWIRTDWLDDFGMDMPETLDEFEAFLLEVKNGDPKGDGKKDAIPYSASDAAGIVRMMYSTFGLANHGLSSGNIDEGEDGKLRFWRTSDGYRELMTYLAKLYKKGLIQQDIFTVDTQKFSTIGRENQFGAVGTQVPSEDFGKELGNRYQPLKPLKRSAGEDVPTWNASGSPLASVGQFVVTDKAEHPLEACRWMDYYYGDEGAKLFFLGIEGESYEEKDGKYRFLPKITDNPDGLSIDEAVKPYVNYMGGGYAGFVKEEYFQGIESTKQAKDGAAVMAPHGVKDIWPLFTFSGDEADELTSITADITKLIEESEAKFITGTMDPDKDWDSFTKQFDAIGLDRYMEIQQAAYERYKK